MQILSAQRQLNVRARWALKEAAIKAHSQRVLHLREISILPVSTEYSTTLGYSQDPPKPGHGRTPKPSVLIDPPSRMVKFRDETVWRRRGIMENSHGVHHGDIWVPLRSARIDMQDRQMADGSISHDGDYVFAMCQALDHVWSKEDLRIEDDGNGPQIHEPEKGDEGWQEQALSL
jgi:phosphopantetheinyl transferase (holo-ACP synthase)